MFLLICRYSRVFAYPGDDVTLSSHLSPETSAVSMEVRWFRGNDCVYMYKDGQVSVGKQYEGRASLLPQEMSSGNVSLTLKSVSSLDMGIYSCQVLTGQHKVEKSIHLYISGSPVEPKLLEKNSNDVEESVLILELKKLLQRQEKDLQDKTRQLETTTEMLETKSNLLLYTGTDLKNMKKLATQTEEHLKNVLETCKKQLEQLGEKLEEKDSLVEELRVRLREKDRQLEEVKMKHLGEHGRQIAEGVQNKTQDPADSPESLQLLELKSLLQSRDKELEDKTRELEKMSGELTQMTKLLQDRDRDAQNLVKEQDGQRTDMSGEMEMCYHELEMLGEKLQEKNAQVEELRVVLQAKEQELEAEKKNRGTMSVSHIMLSKLAQNPKEQLEEIENWIAKKREERRLQEEEEKTKILEKEFLDYVSAVEELIGKKHEKILAWAKMMGLLQKKLEVVQTDEERQALEEQLKEALEMQKLGGEQIQQLTESLEEKKNDIEEKHKRGIEEIKEKYGALSRMESQTNILKIILPDILVYFQNLAAEAQNTPDEQKQTAGDEAEISVNKETRKIPGEVERSSEINNNRVESLVHENNLTCGERNQQNDVGDKMVNGVTIEYEDNKEQEVLNVQ
ncbi:Butyrophilin subfamily 2 member A1 [Bagarius yarrelli]|uniref:Butyrophilin subfamily 2 member A1 n=1 Tax=Bagarius yarrelli TaxID=175774 RepID=A0A556U1F9_BAGYA|nr:Butyrophilin subfamily 2 member A1 [Bagarius yarrelli]